MKQTFVLQPYPHPSRNRALDAVKHVPDGYVVTVGEPTRNLEQNAAQWPILQAFAKQLKWPVNGAMSSLTAEEWKDILSAAFCREQVRVSPGLDGGMVMLGKRTSHMSKDQFSNWLTFLLATAIDRGVEVIEVEHDAQ
jgi:hypothetical protein